MSIKTNIDIKSEINVIKKNIPPIGNFSLFDKFILNSQKKNNKPNIIKIGAIITRKPYFDFNCIFSKCFY
jgi:hypothetical protein